MSTNLTLVLVASALVGTGVYLFLSRSLVRALMGFLLMGNGINLVFIIGSGPAGSPPIVGASDRPMADPVPQALVLTAIVITLAMTAFVLALAHRGRQLDGLDLVGDDLESRRIHARAEADDLGEGASARETAAAIQAESERTESRYHGDDEPPPADVEAAPPPAELDTDPPPADAEAAPPPASPDGEEEDR